MRPANLLPLALTAAVVAAACSATPSTPATSTGSGAAGGGAAGTGGQLQPLVLAPLDATVDVPEGGPAPTLHYTATLGGNDVTAATNFTIDDPALGTFSGASLLVAGKTGKATVTGYHGSDVSSTTVTVKTLKTFVLPGAPADAPGKFGGVVDDARAPSFVYPADGILVPPNLNVLELQWMAGADNDLFELTFATPQLTVKVYTPCNPVNGGCVYTPDAAVWKLVAEAGRGKDPIAYTLRGVHTADPTKLGVAPTQTISFAEEDMLGGLYYWNAAGSTMRYEFGVSGQQAEMYMNAPQAGAMICVGCHVLSRDGSRIAEGLDMPMPAAYKVFDVANKQQPLFAKGGPEGANFFTFSPDSKQIMASDGQSIVLRDAATGAAIKSPLVAQGAMPDWSPDGKSMVYAKGAPMPIAVGVPGVDQASLETMTFDGTDWQPGKQLVAGGGNNYYPSYSPDNAWVLFNRSASGANSYDAKDATCWAVSAAGGTPVKLARASLGGDSWPKWAPLAQVYKSGNLFWLTFSSRRPYGLRLGAGNDKAQIWMTAFDPTKAAKGEDPSHPAFWLPFQSLSSGNHIAQWVLHVDRKPCTSNGDCDPSETCGAAGTCIPNVQ